MYSDPSASIAPYGPTDPATHRDPERRARAIERRSAAAASTPIAAKPSKVAW